MKYLKRKKQKPMWIVVVADVLTVALILLVFAFFHHVLPRMLVQQRSEQLQQDVTQQTQTQPDQTQAPPTEMSTQPEDTTEQSETIETTQPDPRTEWQKKFEEHFTDDVCLTDNSYSSPEVAITVEKIKTVINDNPVTYYLADIYIASVDNFQTYTAYGDVVYYGAQDPVGMTRDTNAILAINGDYITVQKEGFLVRNGEVYASNRNNSICVLYPDGIMEAYDQGTYEVEEILARNPIQVWSFGPSLLDENGQVKESYDLLNGVNGVHPRSAVGYYEPGHYCFVVVDGRQSHSVGLRMNQLAQIFADLGCKVAYNMDGGASSVMMFDQRIINKQSNSRDLGDILLITDSYFHQDMQTSEVGG